MILQNKKIEIGDTIRYKDTWSRSEDKIKEGIALAVYSHNVLVLTPVGYKVSVSNADLYIREGWK